MGTRMGPVGPQDAQRGSVKLAHMGGHNGDEGDQMRRNGKEIVWKGVPGKKRMRKTGLGVKCCFTCG